MHQRTIGHHWSQRARAGSKREKALVRRLVDGELKEYLTALGARMKARRKECKLNMRDIMIATGMYDTQWRKYESGGGAPTLSTLLKIAMALQMTPSALLEGLPLPAWSEVPVVLRTSQEQPRGPEPSELAEKQEK